MAKVRVHITESGGDFFVQPPVISAEAGDVIKIINTTNEDLVFRMDNAVLGAADQTKVIKKKDRGGVTVLGTAVAGTSVSYQILMIDSGKKAKGNSDPLLIIDN